MTALRVNKYSIYRIRLDLPFPPRARRFGAADAIHRLTLLEHQSFDAARAALLAQCRERAPVRSTDERRDAQETARERVVERRGQCIEPRAAVGKRIHAQVL